MKKYDLLLACLMISVGLFAQIDEDIKRSFKTTNNPDLSIKNSFGDIKIEKHNLDMIEVLVEITVVPKKSRDYERVKDKVRIDIKESVDKIELTTINELNGMSTEDMEINYTVSIPEKTSLEIRNQFGDVWIEGTAGTIYARIQHGDFYCGDVSGTDNSVKVQFGELRLESMKDAELETQHGDFRAETLENVELDVQFGDAEIDRIEGKMKFSIQHSDLSVDALGKNLIELKIDAQFSDIDISADAWDDYYVELEGSFSDFSMPSSLKSLINYESKDMHSKEYRINEKNRDRKIIIDANHSDVDFD